MDVSAGLAVCDVKIRVTFLRHGINCTGYRRSARLQRESHRETAGRPTRTHVRRVSRYKGKVLKTFFLSFGVAPI